MTRTGRQLADLLGDLRPDGWTLLTDDDMRLRVSDAVGFAHPQGGGVVVAPWRQGDALSIELPRRGPVPDRHSRALPAKRSEWRDAVTEALNKAQAWLS